MAQWVNSLATNTDDLSSIAKTHDMIGENKLLQLSSDFYRHAMVQVLPQIHVHGIYVI